MKTIIEPFRIKSVEPIRMTTREERQELLRRVDYNLFGLQSQDVIIDLLTDSGTSAMSAEQWAALQRGDESYAGSASFYRFVESVQELMPFRHIIPTHQGRAAERILMSIVGGEGKRIPNNTHFDTTRANIEATHALAENLAIAESNQPNTLHPFKGNMDIEKLDAYLAQYSQQVPLVMITITNNAGGGQPVSLANIRETKRICEKHGKLLFIDGCRFAENAYFIKLREAGYENKPIKEIVREIFSYADGMTMSAKKDAFANIGGWLALNDDQLAEQCRNELVISEGFPTYGGLAGRDLDAIAQGLKEIVAEDYLHYRLRTAQYLGDALEKIGVPHIKPVGAHAVYVDARAMLPHIDPLDYPGQALCIALYEIGGVRACEIGSVVFGKQPDGSEKPADMDLVRLAFPRRAYTQSHFDYVIECLQELYCQREKLRGVKIVWQPRFLRHFTAKFSPL
ncbi:MAG: tryptophanase [Legionellales bacterium]|nr:tryptophanase [Legionellales bacterium]